MSASAIHAAGSTSCSHSVQWIPSTRGRTLRILQSSMQGLSLSMRVLIGSKSPTVIGGYTRPLREVKAGRHVRRSRYINQLWIALVHHPALTVHNITLKVGGAIASPIPVHRWYKGSAFAHEPPPEASRPVVALFESEVAWQAK